MFLEWLEDEILFSEAEERMKNPSPDVCVSQEEIMNRYKISQSNLDGIDVDIE